MLKDYRAYLFDLYGTLVDIHTDETRPALWRRMSDWYAARGAAYEPRELRRAYLAACERRERELQQSGAAQWVEIEIGAVCSDLFARRGVGPAHRGEVERASRDDVLPVFQRGPVFARFDDGDLVALHDDAVGMGDFAVEGKRTRRGRVPTGDLVW